MSFLERYFVVGPCATLRLYAVRFGNTALMVAIILAGLLCSLKASAAGFVVASESGPDRIAHVPGYMGIGGVINISVGIDPTSLHASEMVIPTQNVINVVNALQVTTGNLSASNVPFTEWDFESTFLHEIGHALGLAHCNLGGVGGLTGEDSEFTFSTDGVDDVYGVTTNNAGSPGVDGQEGSSDDMRGDDVNLNWFKNGVNNPVASLSAMVDHSTYSRNVADLPVSHDAVANGDKEVLADLGFSNTESIMQQGAPNGEAQRTMTAEDVSALRLAMAGLDEMQGTADDYTINVTYAGMTTNATIVLDFDPTPLFASTSFSAVELSTNHFRVTPPLIRFNDSAVTWFFNQVLGGFDPDDLYVDFTAGSNGVGTEAFPLDNLADAVSAANTNATINLEPGSSLETFTGGNVISKPLTLLNNTPGGGVVRIGGS